MLRTILLRSAPGAPLSRSLSTTPLALAKPPKKPINKLLFPRPTSRRLKATDDRSGAADGPLDSYQLTTQLSRLTSQSRYADALALVRSAPSRAATIVVWNVLLNSILQNNTSNGTGQIKRAYEVWMDMKKRGVKPSSRSFGTFLGGAAKVARKLESRGIAKGTESSPSVADTIGNDVKSKVETVYKQWTVYQAALEDKGRPEQVKEHEETLDDLTVHPTNQYLSFLASTLSLSQDPAVSTALLSKVLTTFESIPPPSSPNPITRNAVTYALTLNAIRTALQVANSSNPPPASSAFPTTQVLLESALAIFTPLLDPSTRLPDSDPLTPQLATSFLSLFLVPPPSTISLSLQSSVLELLPLMHGLVPPAALASLAPPVASSVPTPISTPALDSGALKCVLGLLLSWDKLESVQGVWQQVNEYPERYFATTPAAGRTGNELEIAHVEIVLEALGRQRDLESAEALLMRLLLDDSPESSTLRPRLKTFETALDASLRVGDYETCRRVYDRLCPASPSDSSSSSRRLEFGPSFHATTSYVLTAVNSRDKTKIWSTVKSLLDSPEFGPDSFPAESSSGGARKGQDATSTKGTPTMTKKDLVLAKMQRKKDEKWRLRYGQAIAKGLERILTGREIDLGKGRAGSDDTTTRTRTELEAWRERVDEWVQAQEREGKGKRGDGVDKGEMELRRERVKAKELERSSSPSSSPTGGVARRAVDPVASAPTTRVISQEELEGEFDAPEDERRYDPNEAVGERREKVGRKERRMGWWKEREGDSMKEEHAIYEERQRRFEARRNDRGPRKTSFRDERPARSSSFERDGRRSSDRGTRSDYGSSRRGERGSWSVYLSSPALCLL
ncbi:hypothetical protein JCM11491_005230 [Sporobolomyces phaffii]